MYRILVLTNEPLCLSLIKDGKKEIIAKTKRYGEYFTDVLDVGLQCLERNRKISLSEVAQANKPVSKKVAKTEVVIASKFVSDRMLSMANAKESLQDVQKTGKSESMQEEENSNVNEKRTRKKRVSKKKVS